MHTPLNASAVTAGTLMSSSTFEVPIYQREYSWLEDEISEFWNDLSQSIEEEAYFLGLVILTEEKNIKHVVDGQQRLLTLTLLAAALYHNALESGRTALAERIQSDFLRSIDYDTDETLPRVTLSDELDNLTLQSILDGKISSNYIDKDEDSFSYKLFSSYSLLKNKLRVDLGPDPFKRLGMWTDFITNRLYFAVFIHPDAASAFRVFEVINTRGRELTTADLLKNYVLSQIGKGKREEKYKEWQAISRLFSSNSTNSFVQYIRHVVTVEGGHILPKDLFDYLAGRTINPARRAPSAMELLELLQNRLPIYMQMVDPSFEGPAETEALKVFEALNSMGVISLRPLLMAISETSNSLEGMQFILQLVVRRIIVGNLGTGNVERRLGEAAYKVHREKSWESLQTDLQDLNPTKEEFINQLRKRSFNKTTLAFIRRSIINQSMTPGSSGTLHYIMPKEALPEETHYFWGGTIANTYLSTLERRPKEAVNWSGFKNSILHHPADNEWTDRLEAINDMDAEALQQIGKELAEVAGDVWY